MRRILRFEFLQNNSNARSGFIFAKKEAGWFQICSKGGGMIWRLLKGRGMVSGLFEKKREAIPPHPAPPQSLLITEKNHGKFLSGQSNSAIQ
jgi:hypothetical protein